MFELYLAVAVNLVGLGVAYGGIRAEIRGLDKRVKDAVGRADHAHQRIDEILNRRSAPR